MVSVVTSGVGRVGQAHGWISSCWCRHVWSFQKQRSVSVQQSRHRVSIPRKVPFPLLLFRSFLSCSSTRRQFTNFTPSLQLIPGRCVSVVAGISPDAYRYFVADTILEELVFGWPRRTQDEELRRMLSLRLQNAIYAVMFLPFVKALEWLHKAGWEASRPDPPSFSSVPYR